MPDRLDPQPDPRLLRLFADGELAGDELIAAQAMLASNDVERHAAQQQVDSERRLREAVGRAMGEVAAPEALRGQVQEILVGALEPLAHLPQRRRSPMWRLFASPQRANFAAVAAVLALIVGAVLFGIFGRTIDDVPPTPGVDVVGNVALYVDSEHGQCTTSLEHIQKESTWHSPNDAEVGMTELLGAPVRAFDLSALGYDFVGAGRCSVPLEQQPSGHLMYRKTVRGRPGPMVSIFMAPLRGSCKGICENLQPGEWVAANASCKRRVLYSTDGRLVYFLVCCDERDLAAVGQAISLAQAGGSR